MNCFNYEKIIIRQHNTNLCFDAAERNDFGVFPAHLVDLVDEDPSVQFEIALRDREEHSRQLRFEEQHRVRSSSDNDPDENFEQRNLRFEISDLAHKIGCLLQDLEILNKGFWNESYLELVIYVKFVLWKTNNVLKK